MPNRLARFFESRPLTFHLALALVLGLTVRLITAHFVYGPMAMDDFVDGVIPSFFLSKGTWPTLNVGRSYLLVWILTGVLKAGEFLGNGSDGVDKVRLIYSVLGVFSLGTVLGAYYYVREESDRVFGALALYLTSLYLFMPFLGTRTFGETVSMPLVTLGVGLLQIGRFRDAPRYFYPGFLALAAACLFRFQNGILFIACFGVLLAERRPQIWLAALIAGVAWLVVQGGVDLISYGKPLWSFIQHVDYNKTGGYQYGIQPWYVHIAALLGYSLFPLSLVFVSRLRGLVPRHRVALWPLVAFVVVHTFVAHKEERFMAPILPLFLILLSALWAAARDSSWVRWVYFPAFAGVNLILLVLVSVSNSQASELSPVVDTQSHYQSGIFVDTNTGVSGSYISTGVFMRDTFSVVRRPLEGLDSSSLGALLQETHKQVAVVLAAPERGTEREYLRSLGGGNVACSDEQVGSSLADRILYVLNPTRNTRRRPTYYVTCELKGR